MPPEQDAPLPRRDLHILAALDQRPLHGYGLVKAIEERSEGALVLDPANLYRFLRRMRDAGWIREQEVTEFTRRRTYEITPRGKEILREEVARLERLVKQLRPAGT